LTPRASPFRRNQHYSGDLGRQPVAGRLTVPAASSEEFDARFSTRASVGRPVQFHLREHAPRDSSDRCLLMAMSREKIISACEAQYLGDARGLGLDT